MPRGIPKNGYRITRKRLASGFVSHRNNVLAFPTLAAPVVQSTETDAEIKQRIAERFEILARLTESAINGGVRALIVSGPPGLGKTYTIEGALSQWDNEGNSHTVIKGNVRATGLFKTLYDHRKEGDLVVFDDADSVFFDDTSLNMLKAVCDSSERRRVSWLSEAQFSSDHDGSDVPKTFDFCGSVIFITNYDFDAMISRGHRLAPHVQALVSRAHYIDLSLKTRRDYLLRIHQVVEEQCGMLSDLLPSERSDILEFIEGNQETLRELSLRTLSKLGSLRKSEGADSERIALVTLCKAA